MRLVRGKLIGISGAAWLKDRFTSATIDDVHTWLDLGGLAMVAGIGFTVALLVAELSFGIGKPHNELAKVGVLTGSAIAVLIGGTLLAVRHVHNKDLRE